MQDETLGKDRGANESGEEGNVDWALLLLLLAFSEGDPERMKALLEERKEDNDVKS